MTLSMLQLLGLTGVGGLFGGLLVSLVDHFFIKSRERDIRRWEIKRLACLEALDVIDSMFANKYPGASYQELASIQKIREVHNRLILSYENLETVEAFEKCLGLEGAYEPKDIATLRNLLRKEFGFKKLKRDDDGKYWILKNDLKDKRASQATSSATQANHPQTS